MSRDAGDVERWRLYKFWFGVVERVRRELKLLREWRLRACTLADQRREVQRSWRRNLRSNIVDVVDGGHAYVLGLNGHGLGHCARVHHSDHGNGTLQS